MDISNRTALIGAVFLNAIGYAMNSLGVEVYSWSLLFFSVIGLIAVFLDQRSKNKISINELNEPNKSVEKEAFFWQRCNEAFGKLSAFGENIIPDLIKGEEVKIGLTDSEVKLFNGFMPFLLDNSILSHTPTKGGTWGGPHGSTRTHIIRPLVRFDSTVKDPSFNIQSWIKVYDKLIKQ